MHGNIDAVFFAKNASDFEIRGQRGLVSWEEW